MTYGYPDRKSWADPTPSPPQDSQEEGERRNLIDVSAEAVLQRNRAEKAEQRAERLEEARDEAFDFIIRAGLQERFEAFCRGEYDPLSPSTPEAE